MAEIQELNLIQMDDKVRQEQGIGRRGGQLVGFKVLSSDDIAKLGDLKTVQKADGSGTYQVYYAGGDTSRRFWPPRDVNGNVIPATVGMTVEWTRSEYNGQQQLNRNIYVA